MTTLVTGATGFVGSKLVARLVESGKSVRILRRQSSSLDLLGSYGPRVEHVIGDITDRASLDVAFKDVSFVYHVAASVGDDPRTTKQALLNANVRGTAQVVDAAVHASVTRLIHTSSMAAFGRGFENNDPIDESADWEASSANSDYAESKHLAELEIHRGIAEGLNAVIVNPSLIFGVGRESENTRRIIESVRRKGVPAIPSGSTNVVDVEDVVEGHMRAMEDGVLGDRYFLGSENLSWKEIIVTIANAFNVEPPKRVVSARMAHALAIVSELAAKLPGVSPLLTRERARYTSSTYRYNNQKSRRDLGIAFRPFSETMRRIASTLSNLDS